ncbi:MAG TPA: SDR family NAD(P)-dependent oxidoreductase [Candidatus Binatia bacterium]|nr:SDR family NAD(P)-dependent oxidoreductase [Candidatus Binatia bacterium]
MKSDGGQKLSGKVALITGGSRGIGKAIAAAYARQGARVFICARGEGDLARTVNDIRDAGGEIAGLAGDIGKAEDAQRIVGAAVERYGRIDVLVNNASLLGSRVTIADYPIADWEEVVRVNLTGVFLLTQQVLQVMIQQRQGSIINVSSGVGRTGKARWGAYACSKAGLEGFTQVLADELKDSGIRVNSVNPAATRTAMRAEAYPDEDPLTLPAPEEIMPIFLYLASDESVGVTGKALDAREWMKRGN